jgi:signal transduction histidine kinase
MGGKEDLSDRALHPETTSQGSDFGRARPRLLFADRRKTNSARPRRRCENPGCRARAFFGGHDPSAAAAAEIAGPPPSRTFANRPDLATRPAGDRVLAHAQTKHVAGRSQQATDPVSPSNSNEAAAVIPQVRDVLYPPCPSIADAITAVAARVCQRHVPDFRRQFPRGASLDDDAILDDLPHVLASLAKTYSKADELAPLAMLGPAHASARDGQGFAFEEVFGEYVMLRRTLRQEIVAHLKRPLTTTEDDALHSGIDALLSTTLKSFSAQRETRLQLETTALSHFLSSLAHDLRNEINGVMLSMASLEEAGRAMQTAVRDLGSPKDDALGKELDELLGEVSTCRETMESTVTAMTRLLEAERLRSRVKLQERDVAVGQLMLGVVRSASRTDRGSRSDKSRAVERIKITCPEDLVVWTDPDLLGSVLVNLVGNAVKYAPDGEIHFTATSGSEGRCRLEVCDHGPGIPADKLEKLFDKFERLSRETSGVGLGLFIARRAADLLRANIAVQSEVGRGTCFALELPLRPADAM